MAERCVGGVGDAAVGESRAVGARVFRGTILPFTRTRPDSIQIPASAREPAPAFENTLSRDFNRVASEELDFFLITISPQSY